MQKNDLVENKKCSTILNKKYFIDTLSMRNSQFSGSNYSEETVSATYNIDTDFGS